MVMQMTFPEQTKVSRGVPYHRLPATVESVMNFQEITFCRRTQRPDSKSTHVLVVQV